jgi:hypothetical protein
MPTASLTALAPFTALLGRLTALLGRLTALLGTRPLSVVELVIIGLLSKGILWALEGGDDLILRVPLGVQECLGLLRGTKDHIVRHIRSTRGVAKAAAAMGALGSAALGLGCATASTSAAATTNATILSYKLRELSKCRVELANIRGGVHPVREQLAELARVIGRAAHHITA